MSQFLHDLAENILLRYRPMPVVSTASGISLLGYLTSITEQQVILVQFVAGIVGIGSGLVALILGLFALIPKVIGLAARIQAWLSRRAQVAAYRKGGGVEE